VLLGDSSVNAWITQQWVGVTWPLRFRSHVTPSTRDVSNNRRRCFSVDPTDAPIGSLDSDHVIASTVGVSRHCARWEVFTERCLETGCITSLFHCCVHVMQGVYRVVARQCVDMWQYLRRLPWESLRHTNWSLILFDRFNLSVYLLQPYRLPISLTKHSWCNEFTDFFLFWIVWPTRVVQYKRFGGVFWSLLQDKRHQKGPEDRGTRFLRIIVSRLRNYTAWHTRRHNLKINSVYLSTLGRLPKLCGTAWYNAFCVMNCKMGIRTRNLYWSKDSVVGIATGYGLDDRGVGIRVPVGSRIFSTSSKPTLGSTQPPVQWVLGASPGVKRPGREADHSPATSAKVRKMWIYTSTPPYAFMP
jgi:hypothetical protein